MSLVQKRRFDRRQTLENVATAVFRYGSIGFVLAVVLAAWVGSLEALELLVFELKHTN